MGLGSKNGTPIPFTAAILPGSRFAYLSTANTGNASQEIEIPLSAFGGTALLAAGSRLDLFAAYTDGDGRKRAAPCGAALFKLTIQVLMRQA